MMTATKTRPAKTTAPRTRAAKPVSNPAIVPVADPAKVKGQPARKTTTKPKASPAAAPAPKEAKPEPKTLQEALTSGVAVLVKIRANKTVRSLRYLAPGTEVRETAMTVAERRAAGDTIEAIAEDMKVSVATVRRYVTGLELAHEVEDGKHDKAWTKGEKQVVVHTVTAKAAKA